jgi:hypothetical protein
MIRGRMAIAGARKANHAPVGVAVGDGAGVPVVVGVAGCPVGVVAVAGGVDGVAGGVVEGTGVETVVRVVTGVVAGVVVVCGTVVLPTVKLRTLESGAWLSKEAGFLHLAWML